MGVAGGEECGGEGAVCRFYVSECKNEYKQLPAALVRSLHCDYSALSPPLRSGTQLTAVCACTFTFSHCVCLCTCVCLHMRAPPTDSPLSARLGDKFTLPGSPVDAEVCKKITIDIAMVTVTRIATCLWACTCVEATVCLVGVGCAFPELLQASRWLGDGDYSFSRW